MSNILTVPVSGAIYFSDGVAGSSTIPNLSAGVALKYDNSAGLNITSFASAASASDRFSIDGASGRLFSVSDSLTGSIFSVNDAAGLPIIEVESNLIDKITIGTYGSNALVVNDTKVGIGTATPAEKLSVVGNTTVTGFISASQYFGLQSALSGAAALVGGNTLGTNLLIGTNDNYPLNLETGGTTKLTITSAGDVGIGSTAPVTKLTVVGGVSATGGFFGPTITAGNFPTAGLLLNYAGSSAGASYIDFFTSGSHSGQSFARLRSSQISGGTGFLLGRNGFFGWNEQSYAGQEDAGTGIMRDSFGVIAQRNSTAPQELRIYRSYTDASNYERFIINTNVGATNATQIGLSAAGTGQNRNLEVVTGGSTRMIVTSAGNVGIGTTTPNYLFSVKPYSGNPTHIGQIGIRNFLGGASPALYIEDYTGLSSVKFGYNDSGVFQIRTSFNNNQVMLESAGYITRITGNGTFMEAGNGDATFSNGNNSIFLSPNYTDYAIHFTAGPSERMRILGANGNVGIGITTPAARLDIADTTLAGSGVLSGSILNLTQTWATSGSPTAIKLNVTNTNSGAASNLLDLQVGSSSKFSISKNGVAQFGSTSSRAVLFDANGGIGVNRADVSTTQPVVFLGYYTAPRITIVRDGTIGWSSSQTDTSGGNSTPDTVLLRDGAANILGLRNGINPQSFRVYSTYTDASNYERFFINTNVGSTSATQIGLSAAGTGQNRNLEFIAGGSTKMTIASGGTVSAAGTGVFGTLYSTSGNVTGPSDVAIALGAGYQTMIKARNGAIVAVFDNQSPPVLSLRNGTALGWTNGDPGANISTMTLSLYKDGDDVFAQRRGVSPQAFRLYNTYTDPVSAFERLSLRWTSDILKIGTEKGSVGGSGRAIEMESYGGITMRNLAGSSTTLILETKDTGSSSLVIKDYLGAIRTSFGILGNMVTNSNVAINNGSTLIINGGGTNFVGLQVRTNWGYIDTAYFKRIAFQTSDLTCWLDESDTKRVVIDSSFRLGVGTSTPNERLTVSGNISSSNVVYALGGNSDLWNNTFTTVNASSANYILDGGNTKGANLLVGTNDNFNLNLETAGTTRMTVTSAGIVSIMPNQTTAVGTGLRIYDNSIGNYLEISQQYGDFAFNTTAGNQRYTFYASGNGLAHISTTNSYFIAPGNFGIGISTPTSKLDIADTTLAGSGALSGSILKLAQTWNTTGTPTAITLNVTNSASGAASNLLDLQVGGNSKFKIDKNGSVLINSTIYGTTYIGVGSPNHGALYNRKLIIDDNTYVTAAGAAFGSNGWGFYSLNGYSFNISTNTLFYIQNTGITLSTLVEQRNGVNPQTFRIYNTYTDPVSAFERLNIKWDTNVIKIGTEKGSVGGSARAMEFQTDGVSRWSIDTSGHLLASTDNSYDIGASGANRPRNIYTGRAIINQTYTNQIINLNDTKYFWEFSNTLEIATFARLQTSPIMQFAGTTASFPAIKRSGAALQVRLADDSGYAALETAGVTCTGTVSAAGDFEVATSLQGVILVSPNSTRWRITVNDNGSLQTTAL